MDIVFIGHCWRSLLVIAVSMSCCYSLRGWSETWDDLPPPPTLNNKTENQQYMLGLIVNERDSGDIVPVKFYQGHYLLRAEDLQHIGMPKGKLNAAWVDVSMMAGIKAKYDKQRQRMLLTLPLNWLPEQTFNDEGETPIYPSVSSPGAVLKYDVYASHTKRANTYLSIWNELRLFGDWGQFTSNGTWQQQLAGYPDDLNKRYTRFDTFWTNQTEMDSLSWYVGDVITDALAWNTHVRLGGITVMRDFSLRPDFVTYPLPTFVGQASVPSTVDLFVNGYRTSSHDVNPGQWSLTNIPFINGAGNAVVVTTDKQGRKITNSVPFYVPSNLLRAGLSEFSFSAGALRKNYGVSNFDYGTAVISSLYRYGMNDSLTLSTHGEIAEGVLLGGGAELKLGIPGVINTSLIQSQRSGRRGGQYSWGYQYNSNWLSVGVQHQLYTHEYWDLGLSGRRSSDSFALNRRSIQYNASVSFENYGSLGIAFIDIVRDSDDGTRLLNLSWGKNLWGNSSLYISVSSDLQQRRYNGMVSLIIPLGLFSTAGLEMERDQQGKITSNIWFARSMPTSGGLAWDASLTHLQTVGSYYHGNLSWRNRRFEVSMGYYDNSNTTLEWGELSGALVAMDGKLFLSNGINDAFVLVKTGYPDVDVHYENQLMGKTDSQGYLLVQSVSAYHPAKYGIDMHKLPIDVTISEWEKRIAVKQKSGYLLNFPIEPLHAANVILHDQHGQPLPVSTQIIRADMTTEYVGWDGLVWLDKLTSDNPIVAMAPDGRQCKTRLVIAEDKVNALKTYGPIICMLTEHSTNSFASGVVGLPSEKKTP